MSGQKDKRDFRGEFLDFLDENSSTVSFGLLTSVDGLMYFHERANQPCYGELRKYVKTHGEEATKGEARPWDLESPFPEGRPETLCVPFCRELHDKKTRSEIYDLVFSTSRSPWKNGLPKDQGDVEIRDTGVILWDLDLDPTVLVNLLNCLRSLDEPVYRMAREKGDDLFSVFFALEFGPYPPGGKFFDKGYSGYYTPMRWDIARFCRGEAFDLTGGTLRDRFDYERKQLHTIFASKDGLNTKEFAKPFSTFVETKIGPRFSGFKPELLDELLKEFEERRALDLGEYPLPVIPGPLKPGDPVEYDEGGGEEYDEEDYFDKHD